MIPEVVGFGGLIAASALLTASPWLWPVRPRSTRRAHLDELLNRAGYHEAKANRVVGFAIGLALLAATIAFGLTGVPVIAAVAAVTGLALPALWLMRRANQRQRQLEALWPDVIDHLIAAVRSGHSLPDALISLGDAGPRDLAHHFREFARVLNGSGSWVQAMSVLQRRCADPVADRICETLRVARELGGGNLVDVLGACAEYLRQDAATTAEIRARQSWIANAAWLGIAAPWVVLILLNLRAESRAAFTTPSGTGIILVGATLSVIAFLTMRRVGRLAPEPRWIRR